VRRLLYLSIAIAAAGVALVVAATVVGLSATWTLVGLMLAWAGIVKVVIVVLWRGHVNAAAPVRTGEKH